jgi:hypothetical protein
MNMKKQNDSLYSEDEGRRRFEAALRGAFATPPQPMKSMTPKRPRKQRKPRKKATASV